MLPCSPSNDIRRKMKIKSIIAGFGLTVGSLFIMVSPAQAETCSTGTYTVAGINTFGDLPCKDPGTEINVTVRGLHDYGVPGGPTAYCSFIYVRKNLGTASAPNWSGSTDTICDPRPTPPPAPAPTPTPSATPTPTPSANPNTNSNNSTQCSASNPCMTYAEVDSSGSVANIIVCQPSVCGSGGLFGGTVNGNRLVAQVAANPVTNDTFGTGGQMTNLAQNKVVTVSSDNIFTITQNGVLVEKFAAPEVKNTESSTVTTSIDVKFSDSSTVVTDPVTGTEQVVIQELSVATISASEVTATNTSVSVVNETLTIDQKVTVGEAAIIIDNSSNRIMKSKIDRLMRLLGDWLL